MYGLATRQKSIASGSGASTPETGYASAMVLSGTRATTRSDGEEMSGYFIEQIPPGEDLPQVTMNKTRQSLELPESKSGIGWKFANQGLNLLGLAIKESSIISRDPSFGNAPFVRQLYLHALTYLLRALPPDLTTEEQLSVRSALPTGIVEPLRVEVNTGYQAQLRGQTMSGADNSPSLLHRTLASTIVQLFILFQSILPYLKYLLRAAYQYDRTHKISEKVLSQSIDTANTLGKCGLSLIGTIYGMGDGKAGQVITDAVSWFVEGVTGGILDGVGEGMVIMGARRASAIDRR